MDWLILAPADGREVDLSYRFWFEALGLAHAAGWNPAGTRLDGAGPYWEGQYGPGAGRTCVTAADGLQLAEALSQAVASEKFVATCKGMTPAGRRELEADLLDLADVCRRGPVALIESDPCNRVCYCEQSDFEYVAFAHLPRASIAPWQPSAEFDCWQVFGAVRKQAQHPCFASHLDSRSGQAQAICGHIDRHPEDAKLSDAELLANVERDFYPDGGGPQIDSADPRRRDASERLKPVLARGRVIEAIATQGPWWRAARILGDCDTALIAAAVEWLHRRQWIVRNGPQTFGPGKEPPTADIPHLDLHAVQRDIFGADPRAWPDAAQRRCEDVQAALLDMVHDRLGPDIDDWERLTGCPLTELFDTPGEHR